MECPTCKQRTVTVIRIPVYRTINQTRYRVVCLTCETKGPLRTDKETAEKAFVAGETV